MPQIETDIPQQWRQTPALAARVRDDLQAGEAMATALLVRSALLRLGRPGLAVRSTEDLQALAA